MPAAIPAVGRRCRGYTRPDCRRSGGVWRRGCVIDIASMRRAISPSDMAGVSFSVLRFRCVQCKRHGNNQNLARVC